MAAEEFTDEELVAQSLAGNRNAFGQIVMRYQNLISSVAYSATGSLTQSEDLSQETFVTAWKQLSELRERGKLRSWLCAIVRNLSRRTLRGQEREPVHAAEQLENAPESATLEAHPLAQAISREEEAILWRSLERIPETYREPLILFYREHESVERVAQALELSEEAVRQRLSRGRKLLHEEVAGFVEGALRQTAPGRAFSGAVLMALPSAAGTAATAGLGAGAKGTAAAKSGFLAACLLPLAPFLGIAAGVGAQWLILRAGNNDRKQQARMIARMIVAWIIVLGSAVGGESAMYAIGHHFAWSSRVFFTAMVSFWWFYTLLLITGSLWVSSRVYASGLKGCVPGQMMQTGVTPMKPGTLALVAAGMHLMMFSWLLRLAWNANDRMGFGIAAGMMLVLGVATFFNARNKTGAEVGLTLGRHMGVACVAILVFLNLRADVWVAISYDVTVAEAQRLQPVWIIPVLSLALVIWSGVVLALVRAKPRRA
jgi:RNA polymerase sigma factor (sigma-70 family)